MNATAPPSGSGLFAPTLPSPPTSIPWLGLVAVLMGTFISTLNGRLSTFGLADIRGAVGAGFDEGAWITTAQTVAQMFITLAAIWMGAAFGARRVLIGASIAFAVISLLTPYSASLPMLLTMQFLGGLASGCFIPLTLSFILLNMPPKYWAFGIALYALNLELSLNISASLEGWYVEHHSWRWIFWQNVPLALIMSLCLRRGMAINSGVVWGLLSAGTLVLVAFVFHASRIARPLVNLKVIFGAPMPGLFLLIAFLRLTILATAYLIPLFLGSVRGYRALEVGQTLIWIAVPQLIFCPLAALMLRRSDARLVASIGFIFISVACLMVAYNLTPIWGSDQFLPSQLLQSVGQSFALSGVVFFGVLHLKPQDALTFGAVLQTARLMGGEIGIAVVSTLARVRGQVASNLIGQHVQLGDARVIQRVSAYGHATTRVIDPIGAVSRGQQVLGNVVRSAATTQAVIDGFVVIGALTAVALVFLVLRSAAPQGPASAPPLFRMPGSNAP
jgi:DHA2 family multidrug resistance protein